MEGLPTVADLLEARKVVARYHPRTPLYFSATLSRHSGSEIYVKYENHSPIRSFKARGALYGLWRLSPKQRDVGIVTASTGNHGQGIAYAGQILDLPTTIVVPHSTPEMKCEAIRSFGGELRVFGDNGAQAMAHARELAVRDGKVYIEDGNDRALMAGAATLAWEIFEDLPDVSVLVIPVGSGNLIAGVSIVAKRINPQIHIVGVQSDAAPAATRSWEAGRIVESPSETFAEGIATTYPGALAFQVIKEGVDEMRLVSEEELRTSILTVLHTTGQVAEGAGAAPFAALEKFGSEWTGAKVVLILSGGNLPIEVLRTLLLGQ